MTIFLSGGAKNGKSTLAQELAVKLSGAGKRYYVATMIPTDEEDLARIRRHIADRDGLGFETIECSKKYAVHVWILRTGTARFWWTAPRRCCKTPCFPRKRTGSWIWTGRTGAPTSDRLVKTVKNAVDRQRFYYSDAQR